MPHVVTTSRQAFTRCCACAKHVCAHLCRGYTELCSSSINCSCELLFIRQDCILLWFQACRCFALGALGQLACIRLIVSKVEPSTGIVCMQYVLGRAAWD